MRHSYIYTGIVIMPFQCEKCHKIFISNYLLSRHKAAKKSCLAPKTHYYCKNCGYNTPNKSKFERHLARKTSCMSPEKVIEKYKDEINQLKNKNKSQTNNKTATNSGSIYLMREREFIKTDEYIYKIGKTKNNIKTRMENYPKSSDLILTALTTNCDLMETNLLRLFDRKFINRRDIGREYYEGDVQLMANEIYNALNVTVIDTDTDEFIDGVNENINN